MVFAIAIPNTIECNNNASRVSTVYIIRGQFVGVNKPSRLNAYRYHCAEGLALQCFSFFNGRAHSYFVDQELLLTSEGAGINFLYHIMQPCDLGLT